jgi:16S rRNA (adenine1518-N6/adenine1519-N6)-dimethyltransferase
MVFPPRAGFPAGRRQSSTRDQAVPRKRFGQNFLTDPSAIRRIVAALAPSPSENVLEIGPGRGALTDALLAALPSVTAIEIDRDLAASLAARYPEDRLRLIVADVREVALLPLAAERPLVVAGNLPYNVSKPLAMKLVDERHAVLRAVLMFQREVADRLTAQPGTGAYGPLTVLTGRAYRITRLFDLPPGAFHPRPKVVSSVTHWIPREPEALPADLIAPLRAVLRSSFARRRQTLQRNLRDAVPGGAAAVARLLNEAGLDGSLRAEAIAPEGFVALARLWPL